MSRACDSWAAACVDAAEGRMSDGFREHLEDCESCRGALLELREGIELLRPEPAPVPGPWVASSIRRAAEEQRERPPRRLWVFAPMAAAVGLLIVLATVSHEAGKESDIHEQAERGKLFEDTSSEPEGTVLNYPEEEPSMELSSYGWDDDWGVGVDGLLASAENEELTRLLESLPSDPQQP